MSIELLRNLQIYLFSIKNQNGEEKNYLYILQLIIFYDLKDVLYMYLGMLIRLQKKQVLSRLRKINWKSRLKNSLGDCS